MNVYDFDNTIYDGDSSIDFYLFCLKKNKKVIYLLPKQFLAFTLYKTKLKDKNYLKETFFSFVSLFDDIDEVVSEFWKLHYKKITKWYLDQKKKSDVIISASPSFLLKPLEKKLKINKIIASNFDKKSGKMLSDNCYGENKIVFFKQYFDINKINEFYTDSKSDLPMIKVAKRGFLINNKKNKKKEVDK